MNDELKFKGTFSIVEIVKIQNRVAMNDELNGIALGVGMMALFVIVITLFGEGFEYSVLVRLFIENKIMLSFLSVSALVTAYVFIHNKRVTKKKYGNRKIINYVYHISDYGISISALGKNEHYSWKMIKEIEESKKNYCVHLNRKRVFPIPKSELTEQREYIFRAIIERNLDENKIKYKITSLKDFLIFIWED